MRILRKFAVPATVALSLLTLAGCSGVKTSAADINSPLVPQGSSPAQVAESSSGTLFTFGKGSSGGGTAQATQIQVNAYLWRATLSTLAFMPLVSADPFGGVVITDWYTPPATPGERFKVNAYILGRELTADAIQVSVFHQTQQNGQWIDTPADPATAAGLEDRILADAANLQAAAQHTN